MLFACLNLSYQTFLYLTGNYAFSDINAPQDVYMNSVVIKTDFGELAESLKKLNTEGRKLCIVTDENVADLYYGTVKKLLLPLTDQITRYEFKPGEKSKNLNTVTDIISFLSWKDFTREDYILSLGGGTVSDIAGLTASLYLRGIGLVNIPTTLLAQVDASIGGKNGVDFAGQKNVIGTFYRPELVYINTSVLDTLPDIERSNGMAELIKTSIISKGSFHSEISECAAYKNRIVSQDFKDEGLRHILNFGHTCGHAIEAYSGFALSHGACVGLGMICSFIISQNRGWIAPADTAALYNALNQAGLPVTCSIDNTGSILELIHKDKKSRDGHTQFVLLRGLGNPVITDDVSDDEIITALEKINE